MELIPRIAIDVIYEMWPELILCSVVLITLRLIYLFNKKKRLILYRELISLSFIIYVVLLFELVTTTDYYAYGSNFIPFKEIFRYHLDSPSFYKNVIGNVALFVPFGYFTSYFCKVNKFYINLVITLITSFTIETIQLGLGRAFDIDDVILNIVGGLCGYFIYKVSQKIIRKYPTKFKNNLLLNVICVIIIVTLIIMILGVYGVF